MLSLQPWSDQSVLPLCMKKNFHLLRCCGSLWVKESIQVTAKVGSIAPNLHYLGITSCYTAQLLQNKMLRQSAWWLNALPFAVPASWPNQHQWTSKIIVKKKKKNRLRKLITLRFECNWKLYFVLTRIHEWTCPGTKPKLATVFVMVLCPGTLNSQLVSTYSLRKQKARVRTYNVFSEEK